MVKEIQKEKTRNLRKYEARTDDFQQAGTHPDMDIFSPFGPMIARMRVSAELLDQLNSYADQHVSTEHSSEFILPESLVDDGTQDCLHAVTSAYITRYLDFLENTTVVDVDFEVFWIVSQYASTSSPVHFHSGEISGVLFLKVPVTEADEEIKNYISNRQAGYLNFLSGGKQRFARSLISFKPEPGDFYLFPGWLLHGAEPFRGSGERRSLAFNAYIKTADS